MLELQLENGEFIKSLHISFTFFIKIVYIEMFQPRLLSEYKWDGIPIAGRDYYTNLYISKMIQGLEVKSKNNRYMQLLTGSDR